MSSEQEHFFCDKKQISFLKHNAMKTFSTDITLKKELVSDPLSMTIQPAILDVNLNYELKNVKIELPKVNIPNEVLMKHEVDRFRKLFQCKHRTARKSLSLVKISESNLSSEGSHLQVKPEVQFEEGLKTAAKILNFTCTKCKDNIRYSPNDLQKHFQLLHYGELPLYPCEMCSFSANDFQSFKQHRRIHRSTLVKCELCNDEQVYTLLALTKHFISKHCVNGHFRCEKCGFSTRDVGTFVQHIHKHKEIPYKCGKCHQENLTEEELQNHLLVHTSMFSFGCPYCSYSTSRKDYLLKHIIALHRDHLIAKEKLEKDKYEKRIVKTPAGLKLVLRRYKMGASKKTLWRWKKISSGSDSAGEENTQVLRSVNKVQTNAEELNQCMRDVEMNEEKDQIKYTEKRNFMGAAQYNKADDGTSYGLGLLKNAVHGPTVLMVKNNKISVPANYSAKFMGFKMVDGKQHIVIKLLPTSKQSEYLLGQKVDPVKDGSATSLLQTAGPCGLSSGATPHVADPSTLKSNCVHPLTSRPFSCPAPHSGKTKVEKQNHSILYGRSVSETVAPSNIAVGKGPNYLSMKLDSTVPPHEEVTKVGTQTSISWASFRPSSHPQVLPPAITNTHHYDPVKIPFFPELKMQNGGLNNSKGTNNLCCSTSVDSSNEGLLSFHNYSKMDSLDNPCSIWMSTDDRYKEFSKRGSFQNSRNEPASSHSELMNGLKAEKVVSAQSNINKTYEHINTKNSSVSFKSQAECGVDSECFSEDKRNGQQYLDTNIEQGFQNVAEKYPENASDCVNSFLMPKITSVFSLQSEQAANYLSPEINQLLQDVLKVKTTSQQEFHSKTNTCVKLHSDKLHSGPETRDATCVRLKSSATACGFQRSPPNVHFPLCKRELNTRCSTNEGTCCGRERQTPKTSLDSQDVDKLSRTPGVGALLKTPTDEFTERLVKDKVLSAAQNPSSFSPVLPVLQEQKKALFVQSLPSRFFVPFHLSNQSRHQVVSGKSLPSTSSSDGHVSKGVPASLVSNKGPGMILTFSGAVGTIANAANDSFQVSGGIASREFGKITISASEVKGKNGSFRNVRSSCNEEVCGTVNDSLNTMPLKAPLVMTNSSESSVKAASVKVLPEHQDAVFASLESVKQQEIKQEQHAYALSPDRQQEVFWKCMTPNKPGVHKPIFFQDNAHQNCQPKKTRAMQQPLLLKIKTPASDTLSDNTQSVRNSVPSLQVDNLQFLTPALAQKQTNLSFNDALNLPGGLMPANASLASSNPACFVPPVEPVYSAKSAGMQLQKCSVESTQVITANKRINSGCQKSTWSIQNRTAKVKPTLKQARSKSSGTVGGQRNKNFKRKRKASCPEPPRKKAMLHRKCKEKNQAEMVSESGSPYKSRASKKTVRTLKLLPFNSNQLVKCPRRNQPVVVLNHPDADVPEVVNVMKTIAKFKGHVLKVLLSKRTVEALLQQDFCNPSDVTTDDFSQKRYRTIKPINPVKERFVLKLTLKKTSKNNYQIVKTTSNNTLKAKFSCWFCGRIFDNQDNWVGHGQRHLMEATRDWNSLM
ncbi:Z518A protein, partial [Donacobius atricapilla]|nr:Z518A protein [Donacobius atricapilla]